MSRALFIVDVQNDSTERGVPRRRRRDAVAERISRYLDAHADDYAVVVAVARLAPRRRRQRRPLRGRAALRRHLARALRRGNVRCRLRRGLRHPPGHPSPEEGAGQARVLAVRGEGVTDDGRTAPTSSRSTASATSTSSASRPTTASAPPPRSRVGSGACGAGAHRPRRGRAPRLQRCGPREIETAGARLTRSE